MIIMPSSINARHVHDDDVDASRLVRWSTLAHLLDHHLACHCVSLPAMTRTVGPLLLLMLSLLCAAVSSSTSSSASLFLHPAAPGSGRPADISAAQANRVLAHLLDIPGETLGAGAGHRDAWDWITPSSSSGKQAVQSLFDDSKQRNIVLFTDLDSQDAQGELPFKSR
jgi:hypothetical protein